MTDDGFLKMSAFAMEKVGGELLEILEGIPEQQQIDALVRLSCSLACMAMAIERHKTGDKTAPFYAHVRKLVRSLLTDLVAGDRQ